MALLTSEIDRIRYECGYNVLDAGAEPYIGVTAVFDQIVATYLRDGATTTSSTAVVAASAPTAVAITLADDTGFTVGDRVVVDVDSAQEIATIRAKSGAAITVLLQLAHAAGYPVTVESGESIVRAILRKIDAVNEQIGAAASGAGLKRVDEVEWYAESSSTSGGGRLATLRSMRDYWRDELCSALGVRNLWRARRSAGLNVSLY